MPIYIGIDWSEDKHDVVIMNGAGVGVYVFGGTIDTGDKAYNDY